MSNPKIFGNRRAVSASHILAALGDALLKIKSEDGLTWGDMGRILGKSDDMAAKYADGTAELPVTAFYFAKKEWNGRFTGEADKLVENARGEANAHHAQSCILKAALALAEALEDGDLSVDEVANNRTALVNARDALDAQLQRLCVRRVK